jgi:hypothetical protein
LIEIKKYPKKRKLPLNQWTLQYRQINGKQQLVYVMPYRKHGKIHYKYRKAEKNAKIPYQQAKFGDDEFGFYDDGSMIHENKRIDFDNDEPEVYIK